ERSCGNGDRADQEALGDLREDGGSASNLHFCLPDDLAHLRTQASHRLAPPWRRSQQGLEVPTRRGALAAGHIAQPLPAAEAPPEMTGGLRLTGADACRRE